MLLLSKSLLDQPIMGLQTGGVLAITTKLVINPNNLKIEGFYCQDRFSKKILIVLTKDIRDIASQGIIVNDHEVLTEPDELVRLKTVMELNFEILGKPVVTINKERLGKVNDFAADDAALYIQKLYVTQSLLKSISGGQISVDRNNIIEITNRKIVIDEILKPTKAGVPATATPMA